MKKMIVIMGVAGCGKTTIGQTLAAEMNFKFIDGDELHPQTNIEKMSAGIPLTDKDRFPWLEKVGQALAFSDNSIIIGCSALKKIYRDVIRDFAKGDVTFVHLSGTKELILERMKERKGHFMPVSLVNSQFADLEPPTKRETSTTIDISDFVENITDQLKEILS